MIVKNFVQPQVQLRAAASNETTPPATPPPSTPPAEPEEDAFLATSPNKGAWKYNVAGTGAGLLGLAVKGGAKAGQLAFLGSQTLGTPSFSHASSIALVGATIDVAGGAQQAIKAGVDRNTTASISGGLRMLQGLSTYAAVAASAMGAPGVVTAAASWLAAGAMVGRIGFQGVAALSSKSTEETPEDGGDAAGGGGAGGANTSALANAFPVGNGITQMADQPFGTMAAVREPMDHVPEENTDSAGAATRKKLFAAGQSLSNQLGLWGGIGAFWNNIDSVRGNTPGGVWGPLGVIGNSLNVVGGLGAMQQGSALRHKGTVVGGAFQTVQGVAGLGASMGIGGRISGIVALGSTVARYGYMMYSQAQQFAGDEEEESKTLLGHIAENVGATFGAAPDSSATKPTP